MKYSDKIKEVIFKDGDPTKFSKNEISINLNEFADCENMIALLKELGFKNDPSWIKTKDEFIYEFAGFQYTLSLQHIEDFAYLLEAEIIAENKENEMHIINLKKILQTFGCQPIEADEFKEKINKYIKTHEACNILKRATF